MEGAPGEGAPIERILPDGCVEVIVHLDGTFRTFEEDGRARAQPRALVVGPAARFLLIQPPSHVSSFGIRLRPGGARMLFPMPLHVIARRAVPLDDLLGAAGDRLVERLGNAAGAQARVRAAETAMLDHLRRLRPRPGSGIRPMLRAILGARGRLPVAEVARQAGISTRQVERRFLDDVGLGAKSFSRIVRFQSVLDAAGRQEPIEWAGVASESGYADQAHLIREFREFSGETPRTLQRSQGRLSRQFTSPDRLRAYFAAD
jgi:AraC-like DNA-binding protein